MNVNKVILVGGTTRDPEQRALPNGSPVTSFSIATNRVFKDSNQNRKEATEYHSIVCFGKLAEDVSKYLKKGMTAFIEGRIQTRSWDKEGQKQYRTEIIADTVRWIHENELKDAEKEDAAIDY